MVRRNVYNPFAHNQVPHRMTVRTMGHEIVEERAVPPGADLRREIEAEAARWAAAGWTIEREPHKPFLQANFFMRCAAERRFVSLSPAGRGIGHTGDLFPQRGR